MMLPMREQGCGALMTGYSYGVAAIVTPFVLSFALLVNPWPDTCFPMLCSLLPLILAMVVEEWRQAWEEAQHQRGVGQGVGGGMSSAPTGMGRPSEALPSTSKR